MTRESTRHGRLATPVVAAAALLLGALTAPAGAAAYGPPPDPAPGGPQRPYEPDVPGPRNIDALAATVTPDGATARGVRVAFDRTSRSETGGAPAGARRFVFLFDDSIRFRPESFPVCARSVIEEKGVTACPEGSRVGRGTSHVYPEGTAEVLAFNTRYANGSRGALVVIPASRTVLELNGNASPAPINSAAISGHLTRSCRRAPSLPRSGPGPGASSWSGGHPAGRRPAGQLRRDIGEARRGGADRTVEFIRHGAGRPATDNGGRRRARRAAMS